MPASEPQVLDALRAVMDPDLGRDIVALDFVKNVKIEGERVSFAIELTTPACPVKDILKQQAHDVVAALEGVAEVEITMTAQVRGGMPDRPVLPEVAHPILVGSGKGGVGKSTIAVNLALALAAEGARVGLMDADAYGPSLPTMLGLVGAQPKALEGNFIEPIEKFGLQTMSIGFLLEPGKAVIWRGPMLDSLIKQFLSQVAWGPLDYLVIDLPPGTGDIQLSLAQNCPATGAVIVTTPQDVALADVTRAISMMQTVNVPVLGIVENMSGYTCPACGHHEDLFLSGGGKKAASEGELPFLGTIPLVPEIPISGDAGVPLILSAPESPVAQAFVEIARQVAAQCSIKSRLRGEAPPPGAS